MPVTPRVSVLMPVRLPNLDYLRQAIESIRAQSLTDWELLLLEDPPFSCAALVAGFRDERIALIERSVEAPSLVAALNDGLEICRAEFVARFDADDLSAPERLAEQLEFLQMHPEVAVVGTSLEIIDADGRIIGHRVMPSSASAVTSAMRRYNAIAHPSAMFRKEAVLQVGGYHQVGAEDYDLWCRLLAAGETLVNLPAELLRYRFHEGALKFEGVHQAIRDTISIKRRYFESRFSARDRLRIAIERVLLLMPPKIVLWIFRKLVYGG